jgi:hypothetical protein
MMDVRNNPALRQQLQAIVRRAAAQAPQHAAAPVVSPGAGQTGVAPPQVSIAQRLQELETLRATGALSDEEYKAKRAQIIADI